MWFVKTVLRNAGLWGQMILFRKWHVWEISRFICSNLFMIVIDPAVHRPIQLCLTSTHHTFLATELLVAEQLLFCGL